MFGRGANPINFVSVTDVAAVVEHAVIDRSTRGKILEIGGPDDITLDHLAEAVQTAAGRTEPPKHIPPPMLHLMANSVGRVRSQLGRQARAALVMDRADLSFDSAPIHQLYPDLPWTALADVLARDPVKQTA